MTAPMPDVTANPSGGLVSCYEDEGRTVAQAYFIGTHEARRRYRKRWWRSVPSDDEMFAEEFPDISLAGLGEVAIQTPMLTQP